MVFLQLLPFLTYAIQIQSMIYVVNFRQLENSSWLRTISKIFLHDCVLFRNVFMTANYFAIFHDCAIFRNFSRLRIISQFSMIAHYFENFHDCSLFRNFSWLRNISQFFMIAHYSTIFQVAIISYDCYSIWNIFKNLYLSISFKSSGV